MACAPCGARRRAGAPTPRLRGGSARPIPVGWDPQAPTMIADAVRRNLESPRHLNVGHLSELLDGSPVDTCRVRGDPAYDSSIADKPWRYIELPRDVDVGAVPEPAPMDGDCGGDPGRRDRGSRGWSRRRASSSPQFSRRPLPPKAWNPEALARKPDRPGDDTPSSRHLGVRHPAQL